MVLALCTGRGVRRRGRPCRNRVLGRALVSPGNLRRFCRHPPHPHPGCSSNGASSPPSRRGTADRPAQPPAKSLAAHADAVRSARDRLHNRRRQTRTYRARADKATGRRPIAATVGR